MMSLPVWLPGSMFLLGGVSISGPKFLSRVSVQGGLCPGGLCPGWSLSRVVSIQGVQVGLCPGWSMSRGLCPRGSLPKGVSVRRLPGHRPPYSKERVECFLDVNFFLCVIFTFLHRYFSPS